MCHFGWTWHLDIVVKPFYHREEGIRKGSRNVETGVLRIVVMPQATKWDENGQIAPKWAQTWAPKISKNVEISKISILWHGAAAVRIGKKSLFIAKYFGGKNV